MVFDDSDMKIVGAETETNETCPAQALEQARQNGNLEKAHRFAAELARAVLERAEDTPRRTLLAFAAVVGMQRVLPAGPTIESARNAFYDALGSFYEILRENGSLSFYYLCLQPEEGVKQRVGFTFAELCGKEADPELTAEGTALYEAFSEYVTHLEDAFDFV